MKIRILVGSEDTPQTGVRPKKETGEGEFYFQFAEVSYTVQIKNRPLIFTRAIKNQSVRDRFHDRLKKLSNVIKVFVCDPMVDFPACFRSRQSFHRAKNRRMRKNVQGKNS